MSNYVRHSYHLVDESPWPIFSAMAAFFLTSGFIKWFHYSSSSLMWLALSMLLLIMARWWSDVAYEGAHQGLHSLIVQLGLRWGMILFIVSEVFFFLSFFWAFFHSSLAPDPQIGLFWPPIGISPFNPFQVPLLNTLVLLSSGISVTWAHHAVMSGDHHSLKTGLFITVLLGLYFTALQALEYYEASFSVADSIYGSAFFVATGFHGLHVIVGTSFLLVSLYRVISAHLSASHHFGFEAAAWYWHFVDVVWLFLYLWLYWWSSL